MCVRVPMTVDRLGRPALAVLAPLLLAIGPFAIPAAAVVIDRIGGGNTTAPADDPGWNNVGAIWVGGGVYLSNGWVLTASHIGVGGGFTLGGTTYGVVPGSAQQLTNNGAAGKSALTDLLLFQIDGRPVVSPVTIASVGPAVGDVVTMIGRGRNQNPTETYWSVNTAASPWVWDELSSGVGANAVGFKTNAAQDKTWGDNTIAGEGWVNIGVDVQSLHTTFDLGAGGNEGQVVYGDSGGGLFVKQSGNWNLAGIIIAQEVYSGQPSLTAVIGNVSYFADLSYYAPQINLVVVPEPGGGASLGTGVAVLGAFAFMRRRPRA